MKSYDECIKNLQNELGRHKFSNLISPLIETMENRFRNTIAVETKKKLDYAWNLFNQSILIRVQVMEDGSEILDLEDVRKSLMEARNSLG